MEENRNEIEAFEALNRMKLVAFYEEELRRVMAGETVMEVFTTGDQRALKRAGLVELHNGRYRGLMLTERAHEALRQLDEEPFDLKATMKETGPQPSAGTMEILREARVLAAKPGETEDGDGES
jgi:hypothetical protein